MLRTAPLLLYLASIGACTPSEPERETTTVAVSEPSPVEPKPVEPKSVETKPPDVQEFGPAIGGPLSKITTIPGRYASEFDYGRHVVVTSEIVISDQHLGSIELELHPSGTARLCLSVVTTSPRYVENRFWRTVAWSGSWTPAEDELEITLRFDRFAYHTCDPVEQPSGPIREVRCFTTPANEVLPRSALICAPELSEHLLTEVALLLADHERAGAWDFRRDQNRRPRSAKIPGRARPYLVLGAKPGLRIVSNERGGGPKLAFELAEVGEVPIRIMPEFR